MKFNIMVTQELEAETEEAREWLESRRKFQEIVERYSDLFKKLE